MLASTESMYELRKHSLYQRQSGALPLEAGERAVLDLRLREAGIALIIPHSIMKFAFKLFVSAFIMLTVTVYLHLHIRTRID